jgi:hypothetical protein
MALVASQLPWWAQDLMEKPGEAALLAVVVLFFGWVAVKKMRAGRESDSQGDRAA